MQLSFIKEEPYYPPDNHIFNFLFQDEKAQGERPTGGAASSTMTHVNNLYIPTIQWWRLMAITRSALRFSFISCFIYWVGEPAALSSILLYVSYNLIIVLARFKAFLTQEDVRSDYCSPNFHSLSSGLVAAKQNFYRVVFVVCRPFHWLIPDWCKWVFWMLYFICGLSPRRFWWNYLYYWHYKHQTIFLNLCIDDNECIQLAIPEIFVCSPDEPAPDDVLLKHIGFFYRLSRILGGISSALLPKSLISIGIVELYPDHTPGPIISTLELGDSLDELRRIRTYKKQEPLVDLLVKEQVFRVPNRDSLPQPVKERLFPNPSAAATANSYPRALKLVLGWDSSLIGVVVLTPTAISILISIFWPIIAVQDYDADVQNSVQTGTAVASYVVTAGALIVALVALFDTLASRSSVLKSATPPTGRNERPESIEPRQESKDPDLEEPSSECRSIRQPDTAACENLEVIQSPTSIRIEDSACNNNRSHDGSSEVS